MVVLPAGTSVPDDDTPERRPLNRMNTSLASLDPNSARDLGASIAAMDPWRKLAISAHSLTGQLLDPDDHVRKFAICVGKRCAGAGVLRSPWLYGPYVALLALLPAYQGRGIGSGVLRHIEDEARPFGRNIWVCVSSFNEDARRFYERNGFEHVGALPDLLCHGFTELLMRKQLD